MTTQLCLLPRHLRELQRTFRCELFDTVHTAFLNYCNGEPDDVEAYDEDGNLIDCHSLEYALGHEKFDALIERFAISGVATPTKQAAE